MCDTSTLITTQQTELHSCWIIYTKGDGKERLTVTDARPLLPVNSTIMSSNAVPGAMDESNFSLNGDEDDDKDDDVTDQSLAEMLDPELQPEKPIPNNPESQQIYREHRRLAKEYLQIESKLCFAQALKERTMSAMDPEERQQKEEYLKKINERNELRELYKNLEQQVQKIRANQQQQEVVADGDWLIYTPSSNT